MVKFERKVSKILNKTELAENSKKSYLSNMKKIHKLLNQPDKSSFVFLKDIKRVIEVIKDLKDTTRKMILISISSVIVNQPGMKKLSIRYKNLSIDITKQLNSKYSENVQNDKQKKTLISYEDLLKKINRLEDDFDNNPTKTNQKKYIMGLMLIKSAFTPRLEYHNMKIIHNKTDDNNLDNFLLVKKSGIDIILNDYKTKKLYNKIVFSLEKSIEKKLRKMGVPSQDFLFVSNKGSHMRKNKFSEYVKSVIGMNMNGIRIVKENRLQNNSEYLKLSTKEQNEKHINLFQHSSVIARSVYRKIDL